VDVQAKRFKAALGQAGEAAGHELYMAGVLGLMQAARRWTPHMRGKAKTFLTFAHHYIRLNMMATYRELQSSHVYIPRWVSAGR
jgi:DNA-directed RNA polymerase specialized sigma subunit